MAEKRAQKDNGAGHVIGGILFIIGGLWSIAQGDSAPDAGIMIIIGVGFILFDVAMSLFGVVRFLLNK
jgi:membrane-bound ClpP family serine protease